MDRITTSRLHTLALTLNRTAGTPETAWVRKPGEALKASVGCLHIDNCGSSHYKLAQMSSETGAIRIVLDGGTARQLYDEMHAFLRGLSLPLALRKGSDMAFTIEQLRAEPIIAGTAFVYEADLREMQRQRDDALARERAALEDRRELLAALCKVRRDAVRLEATAAGIDVVLRKFNR